MKYIRYCFAALIVVIICASCQKLIDRWLPPSHDNDVCKIATVGNDSVTFRFKYNSQGKIDSILPNKSILEKGVLVFGFTYHSNGHINQFRYEGNDGLRYEGQRPQLRQQHIYGYTGDRITADSVYDYSGNFSRAWDCQLTYDSQGRIEHELRTVFWSDNEPEMGISYELFYKYDANGNLMAQEGEPAIEYDQAKSFLRTDPVLMVLSRDFSRNNHKSVTSYNKAGLPEGFASAYPFVFFPAGGPFGAVISITDVTYICE